MLSNLGAAYAATGRHLRAHVLYRRAFLARPVHPQIAFNLAQSHHTRGSQEQALALYRRVRGHGSVVFKAHINAGLIYLDREAYGSALNHAARAMELLLDKAAGYALAAMIHLAKSELPSDLPLFKHAIHLDPFIPEVWRAYGDCLFWLGDKNGAIDRYRAALTLCPSDLRALFAWAASLQAIDRSERSARACMPAYEFILREDPIRRPHSSPGQLPVDIRETLFCLRQGFPETSVAELTRIFNNRYRHLLHEHGWASLHARTAARYLRAEGLLQPKQPPPPPSSERGHYRYPPALPMA